MSKRFGTPYPAIFFSRDPLEVAQDLLGALLVHQHPERGLIAGRIVETEAYRGEEDLACHASAGKTNRTEVMYGEPGRAYVYLIYGMYHMFNVVTWPSGRPSAVLVRGLEPVVGIDRTTDGPGKLTRALDIDMSHNRISLGGPPLSVIPDQTVISANVERSRRIGVDYAGEWADRLWRFSVRGNKHVSRVRKKRR